MTVRAKFRLFSITHHEGAAKTLRFQVSIPEDRACSKYTPSGNLEMTVDNPAALDQFVIGKSYYLDIEPAQ